MWYSSLNRVRVSSTKPYIWTQQLKNAKGRGKQIQTVRAAVMLPLGSETIFAQRESLQRQHFHIWLHNATQKWLAMENIEQSGCTSIVLEKQPKDNNNQSVYQSLSPHLLNLYFVTRYRG